MNEKDKQDLLKDICARLPYKQTICCLDDIGEELYAVDSLFDHHSDWLINHDWDFDEVKPVLRPVSDMTEEERNRLCSVVAENTLGLTDADDKYGAIKEVARQAIAVIDYLNSIGIDYRGLTERNLAIEKTKNSK